MNGLELAAIGVAGGVGAGLRFLVDRAVMRGRHASFPFGILVVNVTGSLALGLLVGLGTSAVPSALATVLGTGLLGGYTTFSTVSVETVLLADRADKRVAAANLIGTLALALVAAALGMLAGMGLAGLLGG